jgi:hypothetical protein
VIDHFDYEHALDHFDEVSSCFDHFGEADANGVDLYLT